MNTYRGDEFLEDRLRAELDRRFVTCGACDRPLAVCQASPCGTNPLPSWSKDRPVCHNTWPSDDPGEPTLDEFADSQVDYYRELFQDAAQERAEGES